VLTEEEDQRYILIIGGINIFLPSNSVEANAHDESVVEERQLANIFIEEQEQTLTSSQEMKEEEEHSTKCLNFFSQGDEQEMTAEIELATEER
jgi:hypothetical protein